MPPRRAWIGSYTGSDGDRTWSASADELADVLETVLRDPPSAETREMARKRVLEHYSIKRLAGDMERLYTEALGRVGVAVGESR